MSFPEMVVELLLPDWLGWFWTAIPKATRVMLFPDTVADPGNTDPEF
jgi:hypothetical protein